MKNIKLLLGIFVVICLIIIGCATAGKVVPNKNSLGDKFALVIGNANYQYALQNPKNDAEDVANVLTQFGFSVDLCFDLTYEQMEIKIDQYIGKLSSKNDAEGFFYFAGKGFSFDDNNYLMPVDINENSYDQIISTSYALRRLFTKLIGAANAPNVVIIDACFTEIPATHRGIVTRSVQDDQPIEKDGLELIGQFTKDIFYLQSTSPGQIASDGGITDRNSPFARALLKNIIRPVKFIDLIKFIIAETLLYTNGQQQPYFKGNTFNYEDYIINR
jgi:hypothetical protein